MGCTKSILAAAIREGLRWEKMGIDRANVGGEDWAVFLSVSGTAFWATLQFGTLTQSSVTFFICPLFGSVYMSQCSLIKKMLYSFLGGYLKGIGIVLSCWFCKKSSGSPSTLYLSPLINIMPQFRWENLVSFSDTLCFPCQTRVG